MPYKKLPTKGNHIAQRIADKLTQRRQAGLLRTLDAKQGKYDFCSNDYLGFARDPELAAGIKAAYAAQDLPANGATGSRLISGNTAYAEALEAKLAQWHGAEAGLLFSSGYAANVGLWSSIAEAGDTLVLDQLIHASMIDGVRLSKAKRLIFAHNDLQDLEAKLAQAQGNVFIGIESLYSMDGDQAPLEEILDLADRYGAAVIVDEAHGAGIFGERGTGRVSALGLEERVFARVNTFGKALGGHGAIVLGSDDLKQYLLNFARSFVYSTALPLHALVSIDQAFEFLAKHPEYVDRLWQKIDFFLAQRSTSPHFQWLPSKTPIQSVIVPGNQAVRAVAARLRAQGFWVKPIVSPTVAPGTERIRICLHNFNTEEEITHFFACLHHLDNSS